jgi:hypothetical protein
MKEKWSKGKTGGCVVSDTPNRHTQDDHVDYYGGHLVAESIPKQEYVSLISAAPDLYEALWAILYADQDNQIDSELFQQAKAALDKAKGEL